MAIVRVTVVEGSHDELVPLYHKIREKMSAGGQAPRVHVAMKTPQGLRVANLWASEAEADSALERFQGVVRELGVDPDRARMEQYEVLNVAVDGQPLTV
jgi:hypothetical protein